MGLLQYTGATLGSFTTKGASGQTYRVQRGRPFYAHEEDFDDFLARGYERFAEDSVLGDPVEEVADQVEEPAKEEGEKEPKPEKQPAKRKTKKKE